jgi:autotransporter-associated beta strand protein
LPDSGGTYLIWLDSTAVQRGHAPLDASGTLAFVTIDTTNTSPSDSPYALNLDGVAANYLYPDDPFNTNFGDGSATINSGWIVISNLRDLTWNAGRDGNWTETTWDGAVPGYLTFPNYTSRAIVNTNHIVHVDDFQEANKLTLSGGGTVAISSAGSLAVTTDVNINTGGVLAVVSGASLTATGINLSGGKISGSGTINPTVTLLAGGTLDAPNPSDILTLSSPLGGAGGLVKSGNGTVTLKGNVNYDGDTSITGGLLQLQGATSILHAISGAGSLSVGGGSSPSTLTADSISVNTLTIGTDTNVFIQSLPGVGPLSAVALSAVPEPSAISLLITAALGIGLAYCFFRH